MQYQQLGNTGTFVSRLCLGAMTFGGKGLFEVIGGLPQHDVNALVENSLGMIAEAGKGALVYLHNGSAGFGVDKTIAPARVLFHREQRSREGCEERVHRTLRQVGLGGQILSDLGIHKIRLLTNTPTHVPALQGFGIEIVEQIPVSIGSVRR